MTDDLRDRLHDMLAKLAPSPAPIEAAMRQGKRIRWRRRATAAAGLAMVIAAAAIVPSAVHFGAAPEPATTHRGVHYSVTVQPPGPHLSQGEIAQGIINGQPWQMTISKPNGIGQQCFESAGAAVGGHGPKVCAQDTGTVAGAPIAFYASFPPPYLAMSGAVATDVSYANVTLTDGTVLRLHPVEAWGARYVAFLAPRGAVAKVAAYSARGEIASSVPDPVGSANFGTWYPPGQHGAGPRFRCDRNRHVRRHRVVGTAELGAVGRMRRFWRHAWVRAVQPARRHRYRAILCLRRAFRRDRGVFRVGGTRGVADCD